MLMILISPALTTAPLVLILQAKQTIEANEPGGERRHDEISPVMNHTVNAFAS